MNSTTTMTEEFVRFTIDDSGKAKELTVMLRPIKALTAIGEIEDKFVREHLAKNK